MAQKILFLVPYPLKESPSQRFRFEQYFTLLRQQGFSFDTQSFLNSQNWQTFPKPGHAWLKITTLIGGFAKRILALVHAPAYDFIFIHREAAPVGPPIIEWILAKVLRKKIIYDFDDAIWLTDRINESDLLRIIKWRSKVGAICSWAYKVSCGNEYLCNYARQFNSRVVYNPTTIDTDLLHNPDKFTPHLGKDGVINVGWTGSYSTLKYLLALEPLLLQLKEKHPAVRIVVIADREPEFKKLPYVFIPWNTQTEMSDLMMFDIGIMPLPDDQWANGKCGFKALQYMAMRIPPVASPVGVNTRIISDGSNGFLCASDDQWFSRLERLASDEGLRQRIGTAGRQTVVENYSVASNSSSFVSLFS